VDSAKDGVALLEDLVRRALTPSKGEDPDDQAFFLIVARSHRNLLEQLKTLTGDLGWVRVIEDRRQDLTLLPREGREGSLYTTSSTPT